MMSRILSGVAMFLTVATLVFLIVTFVNCHHVKKEIDEFKVMPWKLQSCPFPVGFRVTHPSLIEPTKKAVAELNREIGLSLGYGTIFTDHNFAPKGNPLVEISDGSKTQDGAGEVCEPLLFGPGAMNGDVKIAGFTPLISEWKLQIGMITACVEKHESTRKVLDESMKIRLRPMDFYIKHELMHSILGVKHMRYGCGIFCEAPTYKYVTDEEKSVIRRHYDEFCLKKSDAFSGQ